jgi:hypothetical protein
MATIQTGQEDSFAPKVPTTNTARRALAGPVGNAASVLFSPDGSLIAATGWGYAQQLVVWRIEISD